MLKRAVGIVCGICFIVFSLSACSLKGDEKYILEFSKKEYILAE